MARLHEVRVSPLPAWVDAARLLGPEPFTLVTMNDGTIEAHATLAAHEAGAVEARLRGLGLDGAKLEVRVTPPLGRAVVRAARLEDARARRDVSPGFTRAGVRLDEEGRYSLTPEPIALALGKEARASHVIDVCAGSGGSSIGFARAGARVTAIELDEARARDARHNARLYGVGAAVTVLAGDATALLSTLEADLVFIDPPWGRDYDKSGTSLAALPVLERLLPLTTRFARTWIKVPMSFDTRSIPGMSARAVFGVAKGDARRIKFVLLTRESGA